MKLLLCLDCDDVFKLDLDVRKCSCGKTKGRYLDNLFAEYEGEHAMPLGIDNLSLNEAIKNQPEIGLGERFAAFTIPKVCPTFKKIDSLKIDYFEESAMRDDTFNEKGILRRIIAGDLNVTEGEVDTVFKNSGGSIYTILENLPDRKGENNIDRLERQLKLKGFLERYLMHYLTKS